MSKASYHSVTDGTAWHVRPRGTVVTHTSRVHDRVTVGNRDGLRQLKRNEAEARNRGDQPKG